MILISHNNQLINKTNYNYDYLDRSFIGFNSQSIDPYSYTCQGQKKKKFLHILLHHFNLIVNLTS